MMEVADLVMVTKMMVTATIIDEIKVRTGYLAPDSIPDDNDPVSTRADDQKSGN
jgi:hypothetical protein